MDTRDNHSAVPQNDERRDPSPVKALVLLVDPSSQEVLWANDAVLSSLAERGADPDLASILSEALPLSDVLGLGEMIARVASTGEAASQSAPIVSTARGSVTLVVSVYRLPGGQILVVGENSWDVERTARRRDERSGRSRRR